MSIFDNIKFNEYSLLEGQQAKEYLERKQKEKKEKEEEENKRYGQYGDRELAEKRESCKKRASSYDPKYQKARELDAHRRSYNDVMPKTTKAEEEYKKLKIKKIKQKHTQIKLLEIVVRKIYEIIPLGLLSKN